MSERDTTNSSKTDWEKLDRLTDTEIDTSDIPVLDDAFFEHAELRLPGGKVAVALVLDAELLSWFQGQGADFQQRMNAALRSYVESHR